MTAVAPTAPAATRHPSPAPRLTRWLLRLHRPALCVWVGLVVLLSAALLWLGGPLTDASAAAWEQYNACAGASQCAYDQPAIIRYKEVYSATTFAVVALPFLVAAWAGATLTSREMETGTAQLTWAQSVSPCAGSPPNSPCRPPSSSQAPEWWSRCTTLPGRPGRTA